MESGTDACEQLWCAGPERDNGNTDRERAKSKVLCELCGATDERIGAHDQDRKTDQQDQNGNKLGHDPAPLGVVVGPSNRYWPSALGTSTIKTFLGGTYRIPGATYPVPGVESIC